MDEFFDRLCYELGYNPEEHITNSIFFDEFAHIDTGKYGVLQRGVRENAPMGFQVYISIVKGDKEFNHHYLRIKIFGLNEALDRWWLHHPDEYPYWNEKYHSQEPDPKKVEKVLEEVYRALKKLD